MQRDKPEEESLRSVALQNAQSILLARRRAEEELVQAKQSLERRTQELAQTLAMMRATLESTTDAILVTDGNGKVTHCNAHFVEMWRLSPEVMETRDHRHVLSAVSGSFESPQRFVARVEEIYASSPPQTYDVLETLDGRTIERSTRMQIVDGRNVGRVWSFREVTERKRAEDALRNEKRMLEVLQQTGETISSELDLQTVVQAVTDAGTQLSKAEFGAFFYNVTNEQGESFLLYTLSGAPREAFAQFGLPRNTPVFDPTFRGKAPVRSADITKEDFYGRIAPHYGMPKGHLPVRSYLAAPVISRSGEVIGGLFFGHSDVGVFTEQAEWLIVGIAGHAAIAIDNARLYNDVKRLADERESLLRSERAAREETQRISLMKDEFLANLSHELRTPLNAILGWSQVLASDKATEADLKQGMDTIQRNAREQARLIEDLLDVSRIVSGKVRLDVQETDLSVVVQQAVDSVRPSAEAKGIRLRQIIDPSICSVSGDPSRLQQVVWNLLSNAVKFTPKGGKVDVILQRVNSHIEIGVSDSGIGIEAEFLPHLFERFRQADSSTTRAHSGLGLGLSIVKQLVELHGGTVSAQSRGENLGATFIVSLPLITVRSDASREHPTTPSAVALPAEHIDISGVHVLVVDDEADARELVKRVLAHYGADVRVAGSAQQALELLKSYRPDVIISDIGMPYMDGYDFIRRVREMAPFAGTRLPAIALTAFARSIDRTKAIMAGYQMHMAKPIEPQELVATVASFAGRIARPTAGN
jgi:PAS domain S-box-containing protein